MSLTRFNPRGSLSFLILHIQIVSPCSSWVTCSCFHLPFYLSSVRSSLFINRGLWLPLISYLLWRTILEHRGGDPWKPTGSLRLLFSMVSYGILPSASLNRLKPALLKSMVELPLFPLLPPFRLLDSAISWSLQPRLSWPLSPQPVLPYLFLHKLCNLLCKFLKFT